MKKEKKKSKKYLAIIAISALTLVVGAFFAPAIYNLIFVNHFKGGLHFIPFKDCIHLLTTERVALYIFFALVGCVLAIEIMALSNSEGTNNYHAKLYEVCPGIEIPEPCGQNQHGSEWFLSNEVFKKEYNTNVMDPTSPTFKFLTDRGYDDLPENLRPTKKDKQSLIHNAIAANFPVTQKPFSLQPFKSGGLVIRYEIDSKSGVERWTYIDNDVHSITVGTTRCGKTRTLVIQSIVNLALGGESIFVSDPKGELYQYTAAFLERLGYNVIVLDFKSMNKSMSRNLLQPVIDSCKKGDINRAIQRSRDVANILVGEKSDKGEPLWHNGELAVIAAAILAVCYDNIDKPQNQNLPYVYEWITRMCESRPGKGLLMEEYLIIIGNQHPANLLLAQAKVAPDKTRGSFYTSAATTLAIWTDRELYNIVKKSDFELTDIAKQKTAMFVILPDNKTTFHSVAALMVAQMYEELVDYCDIELGTGRLPIRVNFILDEFGNFTAIPDMDAKITVGGGRGIRFNLFLQEFVQIENKYSKEVAEVIIGNSLVWIYLKSQSNETKEKIVTRIGKYTTSAYSLSSPRSKTQHPSSSMNLIERELLTSAEVGRLQRPYQLVIGDKGCKVVFSPDLSKWSINRFLGLGDVKHNEQVRSHREQRRSILNDSAAPPDYVGIWEPQEWEMFKFKHRAAVASARRAPNAGQVATAQQLMQAFARTSSADKSESRKEV